MRKLLALLLTLAIILPGFPVHAATGTVTHYELRTGVVFAWCNSSGVWQKGIEAGKVYNKPTTTIYDIGALYPKETVENVKTYPYTLDFDFSKLGDTWNKNQFANDRATYNENYYGQAATGIKMSDNWNQKTGKLEYTYSGTLTAINGNPIDVKYFLRYGQVDTIYAMMGYTADTVPGDIKTAMDGLYPKAGQSDKVQGFLYFVPFIIQYDVVPEEVLPLMPPKPVINCTAGSAFIGKATTVKGSIKNTEGYIYG